MPTELSGNERSVLALKADVSTPSSLWDYMDSCFGIQLPTRSVCSGHTAPFEAFYRAFHAIDDTAVWKASRGLGGKTFMLAALSLAEQVRLGAMVTLLGGSREQSQNVHDYLSGRREAEGMYWDHPNAPTDLLTSDPSKQTSYTINGGMVKALAASSKSVRGPHPQRLRLDEIDEMSLDILDDAMGQPMDKEDQDGDVLIPSQTVMSSTHQYPDGTMTEVLDRADAKGWPVFSWCDRETRRSKQVHGWLSDRQLGKTKDRMTEKQFETEVRLAEPAPEESAIQTEAVEAAFISSLGEYEGANGEEVIIHPPGEGRYIHGGDWAKESNWTIITTFLHKKGRDHLELAAYLRIGRKPWPQMIKRFNERVERYGGIAYHDRTGIGNVIDDHLEVNSYGFDFSHKKKRNEMISDYVMAMEDGKIKWPMIPRVKRIHKRASNDDLYWSGHLPDDIASASLAFKAFHEISGFVGLTLRRDR